MSNDYYNHTTFPATGSQGASALARAEFAAVGAGFDKLPTVTGNAGKFVLVNSAGTAMEVSSTVKEVGGLIGIGGTPGHKLDVQSAANIEARVMATGVGTKAKMFVRAGSTNMSLESDDATGTHYLFDNGNGHTAFTYSIGGSGSWQFRTNNIARLRIDNNGLGIGGVPVAGCSLVVPRDLTGATTARGVRVAAAVQSDVTAVAFGFQTELSTQAAAFSLGGLAHYGAYQSGIGAGSAVGSQYGFYVDYTLTGASSNYGYYSGIAAASGCWNLYMAGTAQNYIAGNVGIGAGKTVPTAAIDLKGTIKQQNATDGPSNDGIKQYNAAGNLLATLFGSGTDYFAVETATGVGRLDLNSYSGYIRLISNNTERMRVETAGDVRVVSPVGFGYGVGAGGAVTQATSKSTPVTLNFPSGIITMHAAALAANTSVTFTVNNSRVGSADVVAASIKAGATAGSYFVDVASVQTGLFIVHLRNVSAGSLSEAVQINFAVIKAEGT